MDRLQKAVSSSGAMRAQACAKMRALALLSKACLIAILFQAFFGARIARRNVSAELPFLRQASAEQAHAEAHVVRVLNVCAEELLLAVPGHLHTRRTSSNIPQPYPPPSKLRMHSSSTACV
jgi:hypothetical protein